MEKLPESDSREALARGAIERLVRLMRAHHRLIENRIDGLGIHHSQHRMLMKLSGMGLTASQKDVAAALDVSPACVARTLKGLSAAGLIERRVGADGRCREIAILPRGQAAIDDARKTFREIDAEMFEGLSDDEIRQLTQILGRLQDNLCAMENRKE